MSCETAVRNLSQSLQNASSSPGVEQALSGLEKSTVSSRVSFANQDLEKMFPRDNPLFKRHYSQLNDIDETMDESIRVAQLKKTQLTRELEHFPEGSPQYAQVKKDLERFERDNSPFAILAKRRALERNSFKVFLESNPEAARAVADNEIQALKVMNEQMLKEGFEIPNAVSLKAGAELSVSGEGYGGKLASLVYRRKLQENQFESVLKVFDRTTGRFVTEEKILYNTATGEVIPQISSSKVGHGSAQNCFFCHMKNINEGLIKPAESSITKRLKN